MKTHIRWITASLIAIAATPLAGQAPTPAPPAGSLDIRKFSPLAIEENSLLNAPGEVQFEFLHQANPNVGISLRQFLRMPPEQTRGILLRAYYLEALSRAMLIHRGDSELVGLINSFNGNNEEAIVKRLDLRFKEKFGSWAPLAPVDVNALIARMLDRRTIR